MQSNLEWFRTFKAIYETGTLSAAGQQLYLSQPGVSLHLNSLESFTGNKLFERTGRKMIPTEKGKILYNCVLEPLNRLTHAEQIFHKRSSSERATVSVGMCFETFQYTLEEHIAQLDFNLIIKFGEYPKMLEDLDNGLLDLIVSPQKGIQKNLEFEPFSKERIILVAGAKTNSEQLEKLLLEKKYNAAQDILKSDRWYSTAADMEHLTRFWLKNFDHHPDFRPNYIVPNISSIIRCLSDHEGYSIVPDFLCKEWIDSGKIKIIWEGKSPLENTLYFVSRKNSLMIQELAQIKEIFRQKWSAAH